MTRLYFGEVFGRWAESGDREVPHSQFRISKVKIFMVSPSPLCSRNWRTSRSCLHKPFGRGPAPSRAPDGMAETRFLIKCRTINPTFEAH
jgi:hypothetical protein